MLDDGLDLDAVAVVEIARRARRVEGAGQGQRIGTARRDVVDDEHRQRIAALGDALQAHAIAGAHRRRRLGADEHAPGRVLRVDRAPDRIDEGDRRGDVDRVVERRLLRREPPDVADRAQGLVAVVARHEPGPWGLGRASAGIATARHAVASRRPRDERRAARREVGKDTMTRVLNRQGAAVV